MQNKPVYTKEFIRFDKPFDFNSLALMLSESNYASKITSNHNFNYILDSTFQVADVDGNPKFHSLCELLNKKFNKNNYYFDLDLFFSTSIGASSITHRDEYAVYILAVCGHTVYKIDNEVFEILPGDLLYIPEHTTHTAIGMTPRIILSYATHKDYDGTKVKDVRYK